MNAEELDVEVTGRGMDSWNVTWGWRLMFAATALPACLFVMMFLDPRESAWLVKNGQPDKAGAVMARIGGGEYAEREVHSIQATLIGEIERVNFGDLLQPKMFGIVLVGLFLAMLQQWCGINVIFYYAADIFRDAGYTVDDALLSIVIIGGVNLVFTVIAVNCVDRLGRRILMLLGFSGLAIMHLLMAACFCFEKGGNLVLGLTLAEIGCYALTLAPVTWVVLSEIFPNRIRACRDVHLGVRLVGRLLPADGYLPLLEGVPWPGQHLLDLWGNLRLRVGLRVPQAAGDERQVAGGVGKATGGLTAKARRAITPAS